MVYLLQASSFYHIGKSTDLDASVREISRRMPFPITIIHVIETRDMDAVARYWQQRFANKRQREDWFALSDDDVESFRDESWMF